MAKLFVEYYRVYDQDGLEIGVVQCDATTKAGLEEAGLDPVPTKDIVPRFGERKP